MHEWVGKLLAVQEIDVRLDQLQEQKDSAPEAAQRIVEARQAEEAKVAEAKAALQGVEKAIKAIELEAEGLRTRKSDFQKKSAMIKSNEEYRAALTQIEQCDKLIADLEDKQLGFMERLEAARSGVTAANRNLEAARTRADEAMGDLRTRKGNAQSQIDALEAERLPALEGIPPDLLQRYDRLRSSTARKHQADRRALVPIREGVCCDRCRMNVTAQTRMNARKGMLVCCEHCGTMLYFED